MSVVVPAAGGCPAVGEHLLEDRLVGQVLEVGVVGADLPLQDVLDHAGLGQRVEVAAEEGLDRRRGALVLRPAGPE